MRPIFIITSALDVSVGVFSTESRILQTLETIDSIIHHYPNALLILLEGGQPIINRPELMALWNVLKNKVHIFMDASVDPQIRVIHQYFLKSINNKNEMGANLGLNKTFAELRLLLTVLSNLKNIFEMHDKESFNRIFKISGRYKLSPLFDASAYLDSEVKEKYIFAQRQLSWMEEEKRPFDTAYLYQSRLWSFPLDLLDDLTVRVQEIIKAFTQLSQQSRYVDMEHLLFKYMSGSSTVEFPFVHVMGAIAPNGVVVYD